MDIESLRELCLSFPGATEDMKWGEHLCFCVREKMFLITGLDDKPIGASFKVSDEDFDEMATRDGCIPAPYMARNKWVKVDDIARWSAKEWKEVASNSYNLIRSKLPKKVQAELENA